LNNFLPLGFCFEADQARKGLAVLRGGAEIHSLFRKAFAAHASASVSPKMIIENGCSDGRLTISLDSLKKGKNGGVGHAVTFLIGSL